jgi:radical SAM superfamily enzyme YgiQ (UPF0313 family)
MRVVLVGADYEENLGVGMIAATAEAAGHSVRVEPFNDAADAKRIVRTVVTDPPDVVGLSIQFQHRSHEFLMLARTLRRAGYTGHISAGGQFPTLAHREVLGRDHGVDSVVLHDGEETFVELLAALGAGKPLSEVAGLAFVEAGRVVRSAGRGLRRDLDSLPFPKRYRKPSRHAGVPFVPIMGGRGCWGSCSYCSITSFYRDAKAHGGGPTLRLRSPANIAEEMALLTHAAGRPAVFCFHDDNFLLPRPDDSLARIRAIREHLSALGVDHVGMMGKCRPETLTTELAKELRALGVVRLYVGVENVSKGGAAHLNRGVQHAAVRAALRACEEANIFSCYNLLLFEPDATIADVRENIAFIREHAVHPINFCRAEPYYGTPLQLSLAERGNLGGSYLGWNYRVSDPRTELLFRISAAAFRERNFKCDGVANRYMGIGYSIQLLEHFYSDPQGKVARLRERADALTRAISLDTADFLERAAHLAEHTDLANRDRIERETALLGLAIAAADRIWQHEIDELFAEVDHFVRRAETPVMPVPTRPRAVRVRHLALGASLALWAMRCGGETGNDRMPIDPLPPDAGLDAGNDSVVADPPPPDAALDAGSDGVVVDPPPPDAALDAGDDSVVVDPPPPDAALDAWADPPPPDQALDGGVGALTPDEAAPARLRLIDQWVDTAPKRAVRSDDLPLYDPPDVKLSVRRVGDVIHAELVGAPPGATTRWEATGAVESDGHSARWTPDPSDDALRVAVRSKGGIAVVSVRARSVPDAEG